jgi:hypothetical protein
MNEFVLNGLVKRRAQIAGDTHELRRRCDLQQRDIPLFLQDFVDRYEGRCRDIQLPLPIRLV